MTDSCWFPMVLIALVGFVACITTYGLGRWTVLRRLDPDINRLRAQLKAALNKGNEI